VPVSKDRLEAERLRNEMADAVVAQFRRCGWKVMHEPRPDHSVRLGLKPADQGFALKDFQPRSVLPIR
jgi:hypothetical protein